MNNRLYFVTDAESALVEYDLELLDEFIKARMDYHPRVLKSSNVEDFEIVNQKTIWVISSSGELEKLKSLLRRVK